MKKALTFALAAGALGLVAAIPVKSAHAGVSVYVGPGWGYYGRPYRRYYGYYGYPYAYYPYWRHRYYYRHRYHHWHRRYWR